MPRVTSGRERLLERTTAVPVDTAALRFEEFQAGAQRAAKVAGVHPAVDARREGVRLEECIEVVKLVDPVLHRLRLADLVPHSRREVVGIAVG